MIDFEEIVPRTVERTDDGSFLTRGAAMSVFGDGTRVIANFDAEEMEYNDMLIPPREYCIY